jgi:hypothetical protein
VGDKKIFKPSPLRKWTPALDPFTKRTSSITFSGRVDNEQASVTSTPLFQSNSSE